MDLKAYEITNKKKKKKKKHTHTHTRIGRFILPGKVSRREATPQLKRLVAGVPPRRPGLEPGSSHVG
jgi:hypothetical protein